MLHHGGQCDGGHYQNGGQVKLAQLEGRQTHPSGGSYLGKVQNGAAVGIGDTAEMQHQRHGIGNDHTHQNGDDLEHALAPDAEDNDGAQSNKCQQPVAGGVGHGRGGQRQTDADDDGAGDHRRQEPHHAANANYLNDQCQGQIQHAGHYDTAAGVGQLFAHRHVGKNAGVQLGYRFKATQKCKGGAQKCGDLQLGAQMEKQRAQTGADQGDLNGKAFALKIVVYQNGHQNGGAKHCKHMLQAQQQHLGDA